MRQIASIELHALAIELQQLVGARVDKFYDLGGDAFKISLRSKGSARFLYVALLRTINITSFSEEAGAPTSFAMAMRKRLSGATISSISQHGSDRIMTIEFAGAERYSLIIEMFGKGNMILLDSSGTIRICYKVANMRDRSIRTGVKYSFPEGMPFDLWSIDYASAEEKVKEALSASGNAVQALSKYFGIGPAYLEEAIYRAGFAPKGAIPISESGRVASSIIEIISASLSPEPVAYLRGGVFVDYSITRLKKYENYETVAYKSVSELLDNFYLSERSTVNSAANAEKEATVQSIRKQEESLAALEKEAEEYYNIGNAILSNMNAINEVIIYVREHKHAELKELQEKFPGLKIKSLDKAKKELVIEVG
ncbi:MAG: NFACT family protein [Candidatus Micrarchaeia archaeon]